MHAPFLDAGNGVSDLRAVRREDGDTVVVSGCDTGEEPGGLVWVGRQGSFDRDFDAVRFERPAQ